jgi:tetratricopeptide (TPR) repeat protein
MTCRQIRDEGLLEKYVEGNLAKEDREAFEFHVRSCTECGPRLANLREALGAARKGAAARPAKASARRPRKQRLIRAAVAAGVAITAIAAGAWLGKGRVWLSEPRGQTRQEAPLPAGELRPVREKLLQDLASFFPLAYVPPVKPPGQAAERQLRTAMQLYMNQQIPQAATALEEVIRLEPDFAYAKLYSGVCAMLQGDSGKAERRFREVLATGDESYRDEARFCLAKALFVQRDLEGGEKELRLLASGRSHWAEQARTLLALLEKVK